MSYLRALFEALSHTLPFHYSLCFDLSFLLFHLRWWLPFHIFSTLCNIVLRKCWRQNDLLAENCFRAIFFCFYFYCMVSIFDKIKWQASDNIRFTAHYIFIVCEYLSYWTRSVLFHFPRFLFYPITASLSLSLAFQYHTHMFALVIYIQLKCYALWRVVSWLKLSFILDVSPLTTVSFCCENFKSSKYNLFKALHYQIVCIVMLYVWCNGKQQKIDRVMFIIEWFIVSSDAVLPIICWLVTFNDFNH